MLDALRKEVIAIREFGYSFKKSSLRFSRDSHDTDCMEMYNECPYELESDCGSEP